jgi:hypothetical protein
MSQSTSYIDTIHVLDQLKMKGLSLTMYDGKYTLIMPEDPPQGPLSVLGVKNVLPSTAFQLEWVQPSESVPIDTINCRILNASEEVNSAGIARTEYLEATELNVRKVNGNEKTAFEVATGQIESVISYKLPPTRSITEKQILTQVNGEMTWETPPQVQPVPLGQLCFYNEEILNNTLPGDNQLSVFSAIDMFPPSLFTGEYLFEVIFSWYGHKQVGTDGSILYIRLDANSEITPNDGVFLTPKSRDYHHHGNDTPIKPQTDQIITWYKPNVGSSPLFLLNPRLTNLGNNDIYVEKISLMVRPIGKQLT